MTATIQKIDGNYIVALPATVIEQIQISESEVVQVFEEHGRIIIQKVVFPTISNDTSRMTIEELFQDYDGEYEPVEIDWGTPVGNEIW